MSRRPTSSSMFGPPDTPASTRPSSPAADATAVDASVVRPSVPPTPSIPLESSDAYNFEVVIRAKDGAHARAAILGTLGVHDSTLPSSPRAAPQSRASGVLLPVNYAGTKRRADHASERAAPEKKAKVASSAAQDLRNRLHQVHHLLSSRFDPGRCILCYVHRKFDYSHALEVCPEYPVDVLIPGFKDWLHRMHRPDGCCFACFGILGFQGSKSLPFVHKWVDEKKPCTRAKWYPLMVYLLHFGDEEALGQVVERLYENGFVNRARLRGSEWYSFFGDEKPLGDGVVEPNVTRLVRLAMEVVDEMRREEGLPVAAPFAHVLSTSEA